MIISIVNHKGGTGKTTTTINLGSALAMAGKKILLVDFDAQGSLTYSLGIDDTHETIADALMGEAYTHELIQEREELHVLPAGSSLADVELTITNADDRYNHLKNILSTLTSYDYILIDCPPSLSLLTLNALVATDYVIIPMQMDVLALRGLDAMLETVSKVKNFCPQLEVLGILPIMVDVRKNICKEIMDHIKLNYSVPLFKQSIRNSVKAAEAPSFGKSAINYAPTSTTAQDYRAFANEVLKLTKTARKLTTI